MPEPESSPAPDHLESFLAGMNTEVFQRGTQAEMLPRLDLVASYLESVTDSVKEPSLLYRNQDSKIRAVPVGDRLRFGRSADCEISMPGFREISRVHFTISSEGGEYVLTDHGSSNGTYVRGVPGRVGTRELLNGDIIDVCDFAFVFIRE